MMGENPSTYWWSLNGSNKLQPPQPLPQHEPSNNFLSSLTQPLSVPPSASNSILNHHPYLFGSSLLANPPNYALPLADHHHHQENQDFPVSWSQLLLSGLAANDQDHNLGGGQVGGEEVVKQNGYLDHNQQQSSRRQLYYNNNNKDDDNNINNVEEDVQAACSSSWSSHQLNPVDTSVASSNSTMSLSTTTTMFDFSSKIHTRNQHTNQYSSSQYDDTSTSGASKKPRSQSSSTQHPPSSMCDDTLIISGTSKRARAQHSSTQTPLKVRKEKLGDRISALHQLVSPFGKTDTASVLLEATVQIRFLEGQIQALSSPYMNLGNNNVNSGNTRHQHSSPAHDTAGKGAVVQKDLLASRGLCLVPVTHLDHIDTTNMTSNGAEFWTPALGGGF